MPIPEEDLDRDYGDKKIIFLDTKSGNLLLSKGDSTSRVDNPMFNWRKICR